MLINKVRATALLVAGLGGAAIVVVVVLVRVAGWPATRNQFAEIMFDAESAAWPVISRAGFVLSPKPSTAEQGVWKFVIDEYTHGPHGKVEPIAVNSVAQWRKTATESPHDLALRIVKGWSPQEGGNPEAATAVQDFLIKATKPATIEVTLPPPSRFMREADFERFFKDNHDGWKPFSRATGGAIGYLTLSRVGFNLIGTRALIYVEFSCGVLCGQGVYYILEKRSGRWVKADEQLRWVS